MEEKKERPQTKNLKPCRTKKEARERGRAGGIKSGEARKKAKSFKEALLVLMDLDDKGKNGYEHSAVALYKQVKKSNVKAIVALRDSIGEKPVDKSESSLNVSLTSKDIALVERVEKRLNGNN